MGPTGEMTVTSNLPKGIGNILQRRPGAVKRGTKESGQCPQGMRVPRERVGDVVLIHHLQAASYLDVLRLYYPGKEDRGRKDRLSSVPPPSEPCMRISRTRLSSQWFYLEED